ncbi:ATP-binding protein [Streptomyces sp. NPDC086091]|uniref:sensor histidine kinase n=1 Tax=Streptomyces sp. NPDC086091 TaxID=3365751 RepID=UPI003829E416
MSHLRAPAARADRREGGRHGRPVTRTTPARPASDRPAAPARTAPAAADTQIRPQLLRLAVLPPTAVALSASAAVLFTVRTGGARPGPMLWAVLCGAVAVTCVGILVAAVAADRAARSVSDRVAALRRASGRGEAELRSVLDAVRAGEAPPRRTARGGPPDDADEFELLAADLSRAHDGAVTAVVQAARLSGRTGSEQKLEVFVNLARRLQSLVHREISLLDELENEIEDPDLLKGLFHVDHLATRIRRHAENLAVLGGAVSRRQWSNPVSMTEVLRSAIAEVEQYSRVKLVPPIDGDLRGHAVADVIHLVAELVENATVFSAPHTQVLLRVNLVTSGLAVEVEDRGLGMPLEEQGRMNALLADPDQVNVGRLLSDGRIGLYVVSQLARRHGIRVRLQGNIYGGVQAVLVVPQALLGSATGLALPPGERTGAGAAPAGGPAVPDPHGAPRPALPAQPTPAQPTPTPAAPGHAAPRHAVPGQAVPGRAVPDAAPAPHLRGTPSAPAAESGPHRPDRRPQPGPEHRPERVPAFGDPLTDPLPATPAAPLPDPLTDPLPLSTHRDRDTDTDPYGLPGYDTGRTAAPWEDAPQADALWSGGAGGPAPLPVRGARDARPTPAEAVPGVRPEDRPVVDGNDGVVPVPRVGAARDTAARPVLPRRRAQEHIAPQLRGGPAPRPDAGQTVGHDPGLMAAFRRGVGLAETQQSLETDPLDTLAAPGPLHAHDHDPLRAPAPEPPPLPVRARTAPPYGADTPAPLTPTPHATDTLGTYGFPSQPSHASQPSPALQGTEAAGTARSEHPDRPEQPPQPSHPGHLDHPPRPRHDGSTPAG